MPPPRVESLERRTLLNSTPIGGEFRVNTFTVGNQLNSSVAMDLAGNFVVVWQSPAQDGSLSGVFGQRLDAQGMAVGMEFQVNSYTTGNQDSPAVAMDADGDFVVVWQSAGQEGTLGEIWAQRFDSAGMPVGEEFHINSITTGQQITPAVAMDSTGNFIVAWSSNHGGTYDVYARRYDAAGAPLDAAETLVNQYTTNSQSLPSVSMSNDGKYVIAWQSFNQEQDSLSDVYARLYDSSGVGADEFRVNTFTTSSQRAPAVAMDADGDFVVAWESQGQDGGGYGVFAQRFNSAALPQGDEFQVNQVTADHQRLPAVAVATGGSFVITWASRFQDGSAYGVYARAYSAAGTAAGNEYRVNTYTTLSQTNPAIAMDADGDHVVTWQSGNNQDGNGYGIYAQRFGTSSGDQPEVVSAQFVWENAPQRAVVTFNTDVSASLSNADFQLFNLTLNQPIDVDAIALQYDSVTNTATFTFPGFQYGALPDGNYTATLPASGITDPGGTPLPADYVFDFFFLMGDTNHDRIVNLQDFNRLATNFGQSGMNFMQGDITYDGIVSLQDFNQLASRFGVMLPEPLPPLVRAPSGLRQTLRQADERTDDTSELIDL